MSEIILSTSNALSVPQPKEELSFRLGNSGDFEWIDELQKHYNKQLGFMPRSWLEGKVKKDQILIAEIGGRQSSAAANEDNGGSGEPPSSKTRVGYIIAQDRYLRRDELGIVYQLCVAPGRRRQFIGAALLQAQFDRSEYGCRLYCCWCAQDIEGNKFWESMGFYPLAFRNGSETKGKDGKPRVQIFWEKKIRGKDDTINWWFPAKTEGGAMGADRLALPIQPGVHWSEVQPMEIPVIGAEKLIEDKTVKSKRIKKELPIRSKAAFGHPAMFIEKPKKEEPIMEKPKRTKKPKIKIDPTFISKSRELRDRYLEQVNEKGYRLESAGKYDLIRQLNAPHPTLSLRERGNMKLLEAA